MSHLSWWVVFVLVVSAALAFLAGSVVGRLLHRILYRVALTTHTPMDDRIVLRLSGPIVAVCVVMMWQVLTTALLPQGAGLDLARAIGGIGFLLALAYAGMRVIDAGVEMIAVRSRWITAHRMSQALLPLVRRTLKVILAVTVAEMLLSELGYSIGPLIVGLGVTGIAVALAAQRTLADVFGAFAIGVDRPFHEGDVIKLESGLSGVVEAIGLRSTRVRTADRSLVTVPNGNLAAAAIETLTARDRMRFATSLRVELGTSSVQLERAIAELAEMLRSHPRRAPEEPHVHLVAIGSAWLELEVIAWLSTTSYDEFLVLRERILMCCLEHLEACGIALYNAPAPPTTAAPPARASEMPRPQGGVS
jgi:MscS family membrane protein